MAGRPRVFKLCSANLCSLSSSRKLSEQVRTRSCLREIRKGGKYATLDKSVLFVVKFAGCLFLQFLHLHCVPALKAHFEGPFRYAASRAFCPTRSPNLLLRSTRVFMTGFVLVLVRVLNAEAQELRNSSAPARNGYSSSLMPFEWPPPPAPNSIPLELFAWRLAAATSLHRNKRHAHNGAALTSRVLECDWRTFAARTQDTSLQSRARTKRTCGRSGLEKLSPITIAAI